MANKRCTKFWKWFPHVCNHVLVLQCSKITFIATLNLRVCGKLVAKSTVLVNKTVKLTIIHREQAHSASGKAAGVSVVLTFPSEETLSVSQAYFSNIHFTACWKTAWKMRHHQRSHLCLGFMGASALQPKCFENACELEMVPMTLNLDGLWGSVITPSCELSRVLTEHHTWANPTKNSWWFVIPRAGSVGSSPFFLIQFT